MALAQLNTGYTGQGYDGSFGLPSNISQNNRNGVALLSQDPNAMTSTQLTQLLSGNNPLLQMAQQQGAEAANARGSLNGTLFAAASQNAAMQNMIPVAQQNAQQVGAVNAANAAALNQQQLEHMQNTAQVSAANITAAGGVEQARIRQLEAASEFSQTLQTNQANRAQDRTWQLADQQTSQENYQRDAVLNASLGTIFSDPSYWSNPQGAMGMANFFSQGFDQLWNGGGFDLGGGDGGGSMPGVNYQGSNPGQQQTYGGGP